MTATPPQPPASPRCPRRDVPSSEGLTSTSMCYLPRAAPDSTFAAGCDDSDDANTTALFKCRITTSGEPPSSQTLPPAFGNTGGDPSCESSIASLPDTMAADGSALPGLPNALMMMPDGAEDIEDDDDDDDEGIDTASRPRGLGSVDAFPFFSVDPGTAPASLCATPTAADAAAAASVDPDPAMGVSSSAMAMSASVLGAGLVPVLGDGSVLLGPYRDANDAALCADLGVGAFLCVAKECELPAHAVASGAPTLHLPLVDGPSEQLAAHVPRACAWIDAQAAAGRRVALFCRAGKSRSVSIAVAYVMHRTGMSGRAALAHVKAAHPRADPNLSFVHQISEIDAVTPVAQAALPSIE